MKEKRSKDALSYVTIAISVYRSDLAAWDAKVADLRAMGFRKMSRSLILRLAMVGFDITAFDTPLGARELGLAFPTSMIALPEVRTMPLNRFETHYIDAICSCPCGHGKVFRTVRSTPQTECHDCRPNHNPHHRREPAQHEITCACPCGRCRKTFRSSSKTLRPRFCPTCRDHRHQAKWRPTDDLETEDQSQEATTSSPEGVDR